MSQSFNCLNCGSCCGPVPVMENELEQIKAKIKAMSQTTIDRLRSQERDPFDCILRDVEKNKCLIYKVRPDICRMFGFYEDMRCPNNPEQCNKK